MTASTAGRLLTELAKESLATRDAVASAAGIAPDRAARVAGGEAQLSLAEQLRLAEAAMLCAPKHARLASRLRGQALAARNFNDGDVVARAEGPSDRWERSAMLRR